MPNRNDNLSAYRYGFNGQEKDNEIYGDGKSYTAEFWQYDARLGRRWNVDPKPNSSISPYATFADNPILFSDPIGDTLRMNQEGARYTMRSLNNTLEQDQNPFYYNAELSQIQYDQDGINQNQYDSKQMEIINTTKTLIDEGNHVVKMVDFNEKIPELNNISLEDLNRAGTDKYKENNSTFYIARNYTIYTGETKNLPFPGGFRPVEITKTSTADDVAISILHEFRHSYLYMKSPLLPEPEHNSNVENFETNTRSIYILKITKKGEIKYMGGTALPH
jgi:hypothetical protein